MSFWANVDTELKFQGISRKELSYLVNVKEITIHKAIERDSIPSADTALKISKALNVSLEYLLDMESVNPNSSNFFLGSLISFSFRFIAGRSME